MENSGARCLTHPARLGKGFDRTDEIRGLVLDVTAGYDFPIIGNMDFGHYTPNLPLPTGTKAAMDTDGMNVWLKESYVK